MKVTLLNYTSDALNLLLRTKNTRLGFESDPAGWTEAQRQEHLEYMRDTIKSSWEMIDYVFRISEITRATSHQMVRTRTASYAQLSHRTVDASEEPITNPFERGTDAWDLFDAGAAKANEAYKGLLRMGAKPGDARGILPTNLNTEIIAKYNLRTLHDMAKVRLCTRSSGEYQLVMREIRRLVQEAHPWVAEHGFIEVHCVSTGTCCFPRYGKKECQIYDPIMDTSRAQALAAARFESLGLQEADPRAKDGKAS